MKEEDRPLYEKPRILLIDCSEECQEVLREAGWNCSVGTFGTPYLCERSSNLHLVTGDSASLPDCEEQEIVIIDTAITPPGGGPDRSPGKGVAEFWQSGAEGMIDPCLLTMNSERSAFDNILEHGGLFVIVLAEYRHAEYLYGSDYKVRYGQSKKLSRSNRGFLSVLDDFEETICRGREVVFDRSSSLGRLLATAHGSVRYETVLEYKDWREHGNWSPIACNKYGKDVGGILRPLHRQGFVLLLPHLESLHLILPRILTDWAIELVPGLFPEHTASGWLHRSEYELAEVLALKSKRKDIEREFSEVIGKVDSEIERARTRNAHLPVLLNGTGDELVRAVIAALRELGFKRVIDVDEKRKTENCEHDLREDIRIEDESPLLVVDVRGLSGLPSDEDLTQAEKHALMCMRELHRTDVQALTFINSERNLPPLERNPRPFRDEMVDNAKDTDSGLMTTWDLFRLLYSARAHGWKPEHLLGVLYRHGRIDPVPEHYSPIGKVERLWKNAVGVIPSKVVSKGDRIAIAIGHAYVEFIAESIQVDDLSVETAPPGSNCGIEYIDAISAFAKGTVVYMVAA